LQFIANTWWNGTLPAAAVVGPETARLAGNDPRSTRSTLARTAREV